MQMLERRRADVQARRDGLARAQTMTAGDVRRFETEILSRLQDWRGILRRHPREARQMLTKLLAAA